MKRVLFRQAVFPDELLLINDGYVLQHRTLRRQLFDPESVLRRMLQADQIKILSLGKTASQIVDDRIASGVTSYVKLKKSKEWKKIQSQLEGLDRFWGRWSDTPPRKNIGHAFFQIIRETDFKHPQFASINGLDTFVQTFLQKAKKNEYKAIRTLWEEQSLKVWPTQKTVQASMMRFANACYHYAWGICLCDRFPGVPVAVETQVLDRFNEYLLHRRIDMDVRPDETHADIVLPARTEVEDGVLASKLAGPSEEAAGLAEIRARILKLRLSSAPMTQDRYDDLKDAAKEYSSQLGKIIRQHYKKTLGQKISTALQIRKVAGGGLPSFGFIHSTYQYLARIERGPVRYAIENRRGFAAIPLKRSRVKQFLQKVNVFAK